MAEVKVSSASQLLEEVFATLRSHASRDIFAIGGKIDLGASNTASATNLGQVVIRWDSGEHKEGLKIALPLASDASSNRVFERFLKDCEPATFGRGSVEVLDEEYRKAGKMDVTDFCTNFNLAEHDIMNAINQALAQSATTGGDKNGIRAELYKLNVYSAPSGRFKSHVDTPRSEEQMGSLVVCLPFPHQGGALAVRHGGREALFDWSSKAANSIQWAAFFSDCEHEVLEVTQGQRISLTYNLYWTAHGPSLMATNLDAVDQSALHFYAALEKLVKCPTFLPEGGLIGFSCTHSYPHTSKSAIRTLHGTLKGLDMVVYQALWRLVGAAHVKAQIDGSDFDEWKSEQGYHYKYYDSDSSKSSSSPDNSKGLPSSKVYLSDALARSFLYDSYEEDRAGPDPASIEKNYIGNNGKIEKESVYPREKIIWLSDSSCPRFDELAVAYLTYGNQPGIGAYYSAAVIISELPAYKDRKL